MAEAVRRIDLDLPSLAPELWASLRGGVQGHALEMLRAAVAPSPFPVELEVFLCAHDGQRIDGQWWPTLGCGPLLGCERIADLVPWFRSNTEPWQWSPAWVPVAQEQWYQAAIDGVHGRSGTVIDASWPDLPRAIAPTFSHAIDAVIDLARVGLLPAVTEEREQRLEREAFLDELWRDAWAANALERRTEIDPATWPQAWGGPQQI